jgi:hypothetical protein
MGGSRSAQRYSELAEIASANRKDLSMRQLAEAADVRPGPGQLGLRKATPPCAHDGAKQRRAPLFGEHSSKSRRAFG